MGLLFALAWVGGYLYEQGVEDAHDGAEQHARYHGGGDEREGVADGLLDTRLKELPAGAVNRHGEGHADGGCNHHRDLTGSAECFIGQHLHDGGNENNQHKQWNDGDKRMWCIFSYFFSHFFADLNFFCTFAPR